MFPQRRIAFSRPDGLTPPSSAGAPSAFVAWGQPAAQALLTLVTTRRLAGSLLIPFARQPPSCLLPVE